MEGQKKQICLAVLERVKQIDAEWKDLDFIITTKQQLIKIAYEIYESLKELKK